MRPLLVAVLLSSTGVVAQSRDGGAKPDLSATACDKLVEHIVLVALTESLADDPEVKKMSPKEREVTERLAKREALADPKLTELKKDCPARYDKKAELCLLKAKTVKEIDACSK
ncbi:MAG: hypothetical protein JNJ54_08220 [Myxococcaceae bacterium]|nr:hypothetical protein [Myxococcaceae bacterium]